MHLNIIKILEIIKPEVLLFVQFFMRSIKNSRNKKCVIFLICTILLFSQSENNKDPRIKEQKFVLLGKESNSFLMCLVIKRAFYRNSLLFHPLLFYIYLFEAEEQEVQLYSLLEFWEESKEHFF